MFYGYSATTPHYTKSHLLLYCLERNTMTDRATTLIGGRRERLERVLGRTLGPPMTGPTSPLPPENREYLKEEALDLYWNELEWEHITDEEALEEGPLTSLTFPGFLAFVRGLLLQKVMPDSLSPASPRPQVVEDILDFLAERVVELEDGLAAPDASEADRMQMELGLTNGLVDQVLYLYHELAVEDIERVEAATHAAG